jgi:protein-glutamine gamma-glutamyltransferase
MSKQRIAGLLMILVEAAIVAILWDTWIACGLIGVAAVAGCFMPGRLSLSRKQVGAVSLLLGVVFVLKWRLFVTSVMPRVNLIWPAGLGYCLAQYFMALQVLSLFLAGRGARLRPVFLLFGAAAMVFGGDILIPAASGMLRCTIAAMAFSGLAAAFITYGAERIPAEASGPPSRKPQVVSLLLLLAALAGAGVTGTLLHRYRDDVDNIFLSLVTRTPVSPTGFSGRPRLGSIAKIKTDKAKKTALHVLAESEPGYLRGRVLDVYDRGEWRVSWQKERCLPATDPPREVAAALEPGQSLFANGQPRLDGHGQGLRALNIWPDPSLGSVIFAPLEWRYVAAPVKTILTDDMKALESPEIPRATDYTVHAGGAAVPAAMTQDERARYTAVPDGLNPDILALAGRILEGRETDEAKVAAVVGYLQSEHEYALGIQVPRNRDPLSYFLLTDPAPAGHCEYFATAAAVLLRLGEVPTRYVTGLVAAEQNTYGRYWVARNRDAHAWVEAYQDGRGWTLVEATPSLGVPAPPAAGALASRWDALKFWLRRLAKAVLDMDLKALLVLAGRFLVSLLRRAFTTTPGLALLAVCGAVLIFLTVRRRGTRGNPKAGPAVQSLWRLLDRMDRRLRRHGLSRRPNETLHQFADRLETDGTLPEPAKDAAAWYRQYAALRYSGQANEEAISRLETGAARSR